MKLGVAILSEGLQKCRVFSLISILRPAQNSLVRVSLTVEATSVALTAIHKDGHKAKPTNPGESANQCFIATLYLPERL